MKELLRSLPDGAHDFGNGVIGPSLLDIQRANATSSFENLKTQETRTKDNSNLVFVFPESRLGRFFKEALGKVPKRLTLPVGIVLSLVAVACSGGENKNTVENNRELKNEESSGYSLPFPEGETWYLTQGPHGDGYSNGVNYAIDIAPSELGRLNGNCPTDGSRLSIDNRVVTASASGKVTAKGDDKNRNDPHHSEIRIEDKNGLTLVYVHLDNTKVKLGNNVEQGDPLGNPSCEFPPGGSNSGPHVHIGLMKGGKAIPIDGVIIGGWTVHEGKNGQEGTMTRNGEATRTADVGRYGENSTSIRNDLSNTSNKAVIAGPKNPIAPISGNVKEKSTTVIPCQVTTFPSVLTLTSEETEEITANVTSGLAGATITQMRFGSYDTSIAIVDSGSDPVAPYLTTARGVAVGNTAVWGTADLSDGRICQSTGTTDTDVNIAESIEQDWTRFRSVSYPYQIDYPSGWTAQNNLWGQAIDIFKEETQGNFQTNINIFSEPVNSWVTSEDYANNLIVKYSQVGIQANIKDVDVMPGNLIRVAGQDTYFIFASTSAETNLFVNQDTISYSVVFVRDGKGWQITLTLASHADNDSFESTFNNFQKMLASFKFLQ